MLNALDLAWWTQTILTGGMLTGCTFNALTAPRAERLRPPRRMPKVSLLIPARNEAANLDRLLPCVANLRWPQLEIVLLDDQSEDDTFVRAQEAQEGLPHLRVLRGLPLPPGWLGKNWACHQLAQAAHGDVLVFCDADARPEPEAIARTVALLERFETGMASFIPRQELGSFAEKAVIPVLLHLSCCAALPLRLIPHLQWRALGIANGQWLAFTREGYARIGGHQAVRDCIVEDLALAQRAQATGARLALALAASSLTVRMYRNFREVWQGFGKNLFVLAGPPWRAIPLLLVFLLANAAPWWTAAFGWLLAPTRTEALEMGLPLLLLLAARLVTLTQLREPWSSLPWHLPGALLIPAIVIRSLRGHQLGTLTWKGRILPTGHLAPKETYP